MGDTTIAGTIRPVSRAVAVSEWDDASSAPGAATLTDAERKAAEAKARREAALAASGAYWLERLLDDTAASERRLAIEMAVDPKTVRRWRSGALRAPAAAVAHMRAIYVCRIAAPGLSWQLWATTDEQLTEAADSLVHVAREPVDIQWREARRTHAASLTREGVSAGPAKPWRP